MPVIIVTLISAVCMRIDYYVRIARTLFQLLHEVIGHLDREIEIVKSAHVGVLGGNEHQDVRMGNTHTKHMC